MNFSAGNTLKIFFLILFMIIGQKLFSQPGTELIKINENLQLSRLTSNCYIHISYSEIPGYGRTSANGVILIHNNKAFLFDTPWNDKLTKDLLEYLRDSLGVIIIGFVPNHWHEDCMGGIEYLSNHKIPTWANKLTIDLAKSNKLPLPKNSFSDSLKLFLDNVEIECYYPGPAHTIDNIVVWIPSEKLLFAGCMIKSMSSQSLGNTEDGDLKAYPATIEYLSKKFEKADIVVPGHGDWGGYELITHTLDLSKNINY